MLARIFRGGLDKLREAGVALLGGHTVQDPEIKFGYAVTGEVHPERIWRNAGARPGDVLFLTKPLGTGIIATAIKFDRAPERGRSRPWLDAALNRGAGEVAAGASAGAVHACTDITGFGLIGHASEMAAASGCTLEIERRAVPLLDGRARAGPRQHPGGGRTNAAALRVPIVRLAAEVDPRLVDLFTIPQTSGGLLVRVTRRSLRASTALRPSSRDAACRPRPPASANRCWSALDVPLGGGLRRLAAHRSLCRKPRAMPKPRSRCR